MLFNDNLRALSAVLPKPVVKVLKKYKPRNAQITGKLEDGSLNLSIGGRSQYSPDALTAAANAVNAYCEAPSRLSYPILNPNAPGAQETAHGRFAARLIDTIGDPALQKDPAPGGAYLVSFGLGLGIHLPMLVDRLDIRNLLVVAESPDAIWCSMQIVPWARILSDLRARGGDLQIGLMENPNVNAVQIINTLRGRHFALVDGSYFFTDPSLPQMQQLEKMVRDNLSILYGTVGFFEDEILMLKNACRNRSLYRHHYLAPTGKTERDLPPAIAVGSGPSLDHNIEQLKRIRDHVVIFGSGTGTSALLQNGITPDFHCEIENHPEYAQQVDVEIRSGEQDFSGIAFLAPFIVDPRLAANFSDILFYHRELLVPTRLWAGKREVLWHTTPTVANLACTAAATMGFREIYLVGVDLGSRHRDKGHAAGGFYDRHEDWVRTYPFTIPVPGNFGGTVYTNSQFQQAKSGFETFIASQPKATVYNASDGIAIAGIAPRKLDDFTPGGKAYAPGEIRNRLLSRLAEKEAGDRVGTDGIDAYRETVLGLFDRFRTIIDESMDGDVAALHDKLLPDLIAVHLDAAHTLEVAARQTFTGSVFSMIQTGIFFEKRLPPDALGAFRAAYFTLLKKTFAEMQDTFSATLTLDQSERDVPVHA